MSHHKPTALLAVLALIVFPALALAGVPLKLTKVEAHAATVKRLGMLREEWSEVIISYAVVPARDCQRRSQRVIHCGYELTNDPEGAASPIVCGGKAKITLNHGNTKTVNVGVTLGTCEDGGVWLPGWR